MRARNLVPVAAASAAALFPFSDINGESMEATAAAAPAGHASVFAQCVDSLRHASMAPFAATATVSETGHDIANISLHAETNGRLIKARKNSDGSECKGELDATINAQLKAGSYSRRISPSQIYIQITGLKNNFTGDPLVHDTDPSSFSYRFVCNKAKKAGRKSVDVYTRAAMTYTEGNKVANPVFSQRVGKLACV